MCCKELWDGIASFPFLKYGPVHPTLNETRKEAAFLNQLLSWHGHFTELGALPSEKDNLIATQV